jgi:histone-lysine N-methyltransferase SETMAR
MDETSLYHYDPETKQQSMEWRYSGSPGPKEFRVQKSAGKVLASIFWDQDGILLIDYLPKGQTINAEYYSSLLVQLKDILKEKRRGKVTKMVLFLHDSALAHRALATQKKLAYMGFQCLDHQPYSLCRVIKFLPISNLFVYINADTNIVNNTYVNLNCSQHHH